MNHEELLRVIGLVVCLIGTIGCIGWFWYLFENAKKS